MQGNKSWGTTIRLALTLLATLGGLIFSSMFLNINLAHASGVIETPTAATPWAVGFDKTGHVWVAEPGCDAEPNCSSAFPSYIGEYNQSNNTLVQNYLEPNGYSSPVFLVVDKTTGNIWFTEPTTNAIGELIPGKQPKWNQWTVPTKNVNPYDLIMDGRGNIWFTEFTGNQIGFFNTVTKSFVETVVPTANSRPYGITKAPSGKIWFVENAVQQIASFTPTQTGTIKIKEQVINSPGGPIPHLITADKAGNIWYSEGFSGDLGMFNPTSKTHTNISVAPKGSQTHISGVGVDSKGRIWFDDSLSARVGYYDPATSTVKTLTLNNLSAHPYDGLALDKLDNTWFTEEFGGPTGTLGEIPAGTL